MHASPLTFQNIILALQRFWSNEGCLIVQPYDMPMGAGTFHPETFLRAIGPEPWRCVFVQPSRRPTDGRYGDSPNRLQHFYQMQVLLKPSPPDIQACYLRSLEMLGINSSIDDIRFVEDNWKSPTLGAWGLGWEVWQNGMEISQFTYFQQVGGISCQPISGELTYGLERIAMYLQRIDNVYDLVWSSSAAGSIYYGELFRDNERQMSAYHFTEADCAFLHRQFNDCERECERLLQQALIRPAYEMVLQASHSFNLLDARGVISVPERQRFVLRVHKLACQVASQYKKGQENP